MIFIGSQRWIRKGLKAEERQRASYNPMVPTIERCDWVNDQIAAI